MFTEFTESSDRVGLMMGSRPSWWLADDGRVGQPVVNETLWQQHLASDFSGLDLVIQDHADLRKHCASFMVTTKPAKSNKIPFTHVAVLEAATLSQESRELADNVASRLQALGLETQKITLEEAAVCDADGKPFVSGKAIVSLLEAENPLIADLSKAEFDSVKTVLLGCKGGLWVSRGGIQVDSSSNPLFCATTGLLRTVRTEKPDTPVFQLDLSTKAQLSSAKTAETILKTFKSQSESESPDYESEVCENHGRIYIPRLYDEKPMNHALHMRDRQYPPELQPLVQPGRPLRLDIGNPGMLDTIHFVDDEAPLAPLGETEVEIEVKANGVNFM